MKIRSGISQITRLGICFIFLTILTLPGPVLAAESHPSLLFNDITETPGYQYSTLQPWKGYQQQIISSANAVLKRDFNGNLGNYDRVFYRGDFARDAGFAYQITKKPEYAAKAKEALLAMDKGTVTTKTDKALSLGGYSLAYDLVQPTLDPESDGIIRDKLAQLADSVYQGLNDKGSSKNYVSFADFHGQAYPMVGIAGAALADYTNPNHISLSSGPEDWTRAGTDYLFVDDKLHSYGRSLFSFGFDEVSGKHLNGAYKAYVISDYAWWLQVYNHYYQKNPFEQFPATKRAFTSEIWESLPNGYGNDYVTSGNLKWSYHREFVNLVNDTEKGILLKFDETIEKSTLLPYSSSIGGQVPVGLLYSTYGNYDTIPRSNPGTAGHLDPTAIFQVLRASDAPDADWMSVVTWNVRSNSNRDMAHMDQTGIEYYSRGDLLLSDAGENKYVLDKIYGQYEIHHNTIAIEDPRKPFAPSSWADSPARGIYKGNANELVTPVTVPAVIQAPWMEGIDVHATIRKVTGDKYGDATVLSSPVDYTRTILYPESDYFIIADRLEGSEPWVYSSLLRPASQSITPSTMDNTHNVAPEAVGHVNGNLQLGSTPFDWLSLPYKTETETKITTNEIRWSTTNPFGNAVDFRIISVPPAEITVNKIVGRIAGYDARSEVFSPVLRLRAPASQNLYRITALLPRYQSEEEKTAEELPVQGNGHAIKIHSSRADDFIYAGSGTSAFDAYSTDAAVVLIRRAGDTTEVTLIGGTYLNNGNVPLVSLSRTVDYFTVKKSGQSVEYRTGDDTTLDKALFENRAVPRDPESRKTQTSPPFSGDGTKTPSGQGSVPGPDSFIGSIMGAIRGFFSRIGV